MESRSSEYLGESGIVGTDDKMPSDRRFASLDGLRAIAILLIIIHNAGSVNGGADGIALKLWAVLSNAGWVGVQLFFALSGFLITRILLDAKGEPGWLRSFYARRVLRIMPLYYAFLFFVFVIAPHIDALRPLSTGGTLNDGWFWAYLANWVTPFGHQAAGLPHLWSLAVEEQFYLLWPLIIAIASERVVVRVAALTVIAALATRAAVHAIYPESIATLAAYSWTIARADAIVLGGLVAVGVRHPRILAFMRAHLWSAFVAVSLAVLVTLAVQRGLSSEGLVGDFVNKPLSGIMSALLVLACVSGSLPGLARNAVEGKLVRGLSRPTLTTIGKYSYGIYVMHMPVHVLLRGSFHDLLANGSGSSRFNAHVGYSALVFTISTLLAFVSWHLLEQRFLSLKRYFPMPVRRFA